MSISPFVAAGFLCEQERRSGFKLAIVVGHYEHKVRVRYWRAASRQWTKPTLVEVDALDHLFTADREKHGKVIEQARAEAIASGIAGRVWS